MGIVASTVTAVQWSAWGVQRGGGGWVEGQVGRLLGGGGSGGRVEGVKWPGVERRESRGTSRFLDTTILSTPDLPCIMPFTTSLYC